MSKKQKDLYRPADDGVYFLPLGGSGEIGMNMNLYGCADKWLMVDCGVTFGDESTPGIEIIMPDIEFIADRRDDLVALVVTHGHEDHIGAIEYLWTHLRCPIYATKFTAELIRAKLAEHPDIRRVRIIEIPQGGHFELGPFKVEMINVTHSIPEANMLAIHTKHGTVLHTGDWKLDTSPLVGDLTDKARLTELGKNGIMAVVGDSTNATVAGISGSETGVQSCFLDLFGKPKERIIVTCFSSNIARVKIAAQAAKKHGRKLALVGRSLWRNAEIAYECGYLPEFPSFLSERDAAKTPREKIVYVCTGSQGEPRSALSRLAVNDHPALRLESGDTVIYSSRDIPGNEKAIGRVQNLLIDQGIHIITLHQEPEIHVSGHPARDELAELYQWTRPALLVPVHGEIRHQTAHAQLGQECQIPATLIPTNGEMIRLGPGPAEVVGQVPVGRIGLDGKILRPLRKEAMKDRHRMIHNGAAVVTLVMDRKGRLLDRPKVALLGFLEDDEDSELLEEAMLAIEEAIDTMPKSARVEDQAVRHLTQQILRRTLNEFHGKKPVTEVHVVRLG